jgi:three-Cys-motif partner protein
MPKVDDVGYSDTTKIKIDKLERIFGMHLAVTQSVLNKYPQYHRTYRYVDLTSGKGFTPNGIKGSPIVFLEEVESGGFEIPYRADFIERNKRNIQELEGTVRACGWESIDVHFHHGDYEQKIRELFPRVDKKEFGLVFVDHSGNLPDFETLQYVAEVRPKMEILIYLASTNVKRLHHHTNKFLADYMSQIGKDHWLISTPVSWDQFKWVFLLASNTDIFKDYKSIDFYRLDSKRGKELFIRVNLTEQQRVEAVQPPLFK